MYKKKLIVLCITLLLASCTSLDFVYKNNDHKIPIVYKTKYQVVGEDAEVLNSFLQKNLGSPEEGVFFDLFVDSSKKIDAAVIDKDATASKFNIIYSIFYNLKDSNRGCVIIQKTITTKTSYKTKSAGYSFGTDISEKEVSAKSIESNVNQFFNSLIISNKNLTCNNAN